MKLLPSQKTLVSPGLKPVSHDLYEKFEGDVLTALGILVDKQFKNEMSEIVSGES